MHAGDRDSVLQPHQFRQHFGALNYGDVQLLRLGHLRIVFRNRRTSDHDFGADNVLRAMPFEGDRSQPGQPDRQIAPNETQSPRYQDRSSPIEISQLCTQVRCTNSVVRNLYMNGTGFCKSE